LEFDPDILRRYVNFLNNPDEDTAVEQFGKGDKYFGLCTLMVTLPGLPMFGHGQIEGFAEKYGMEYQRAYFDETPDAYLVARHEREIFPLLKRRYLFADAADFTMYDFWTANGEVNEDVFAYSNKHRDERGLVIYHNKFADAAGWIRSSVGVAYKRADGEKEIVQRTLSDALGIVEGENRFVIFRDNVSNLEYVRDASELCERGLFVELKAYETHVFLDFRQVVDADGQYARIAAKLSGQGIPSIDIALRELELEPVLAPFRDLFSADLLQRLIEPRLGKATRATKTSLAQDEALLQEVRSKSTVLLAAIRAYLLQAAVSPPPGELKTRQSLEAALRLPTLVTGKAGTYLKSGLDKATWATLLSWLLIRDNAETIAGEDAATQSRVWLDEWLFGYALAQSLREFGLEPFEADSAVDMVKLLASESPNFILKDAADAGALLTALFADRDAQRLLGVNRYKGVDYFNQQGFEKMLWWIFAVNALGWAEEAAEVSKDRLKVLQATLLNLQRAAADTGYEVEKVSAQLRTISFGSSPNMVGV
jgi:hypothetical protein